MKKVNPKKTLTYDIGAEWVSFASGEEHGSPAAHIVIEFPPVVEEVSAFRASLEAVFAEILEICK